MAIYKNNCSHTNNVRVSVEILGTAFMITEQRISEMYSHTKHSQTHKQNNRCEDLGHLALNT